MRRSPPPSRPADGWRPAPGTLALAAALLAGVIAWWGWPEPAPAPPPAPPTGVAPGASPWGQALPPAASAPGTNAAVGAGPAPAQALAAAPRIVRQRDPGGDLSPDLSDYVNEGERPTMNEVIQRLHAAGVFTGLGAFQPPGTRPPLIGLAVPPDFPLPPGYVRHHQATDDGQRIEPILMYSPDHPPLDAQGQPIAVPADRVVPPDAAPPGLPIRQIVVPAPRER